GLRRVPGLRHRPPGPAARVLGPGRPRPRRQPLLQDRQAAQARQRQGARELHARRDVRRREHRLGPGDDRPEEPQPLPLRTDDRRCDCKQLARQPRRNESPGSPRALVAGCAIARTVRGEPADLSANTILITASTTGWPGPRKPAGGTRCWDGRRRRRRETFYGSAWRRYASTAASLPLTRSPLRVSTTAPSGRCL